MTLSPCCVSSGPSGSELCCTQQQHCSSHRQQGGADSQSCILIALDRKRCQQPPEPTPPPASSAWTAQAGVAGKSIRVNYSTRQKPSVKGVTGPLLVTGYARKIKQETAWLQGPRFSKGNDIRNIHLNWSQSMSFIAFFFPPESLVSYNIGWTLCWHFCSIRNFFQRLLLCFTKKFKILPELAAESDVAWEPHSSEQELLL